MFAILGPMTHRVLVIDDEPVVQKLLARILERHGMTVAIAADGAAGLDAIARGAFRVAFVDATIPPDGCIPLMHALAALDPRPAIVLVSGAPLDAAQEALLESVGGAYVAKPFGPQALLEAAARAGAPPSSPVSAGRGA
ncbi:MAG: response regulator [Myxococcota bacterium]